MVVPDVIVAILAMDAYNRRGDGLALPDTGAIGNDTLALGLPGSGFWKRS